MFKRPNLPLEFKAFTLIIKKLIWRHMTINRYGGIEVIMADAV